LKGRPKLLLVDDGERYVELAHALLRDYDYATRCDLPGPCWECPKRPGCTLTHAHNAREATDALAKHPDTDVVLLDVAFDIPEHELVGDRGPDLERRRRLQGLAILDSLRKSRGDLPIVLMTSLEDLALERAEEALAADEFVTLAGRDAFDARAISMLIERIAARVHSAPEAGGYAFGKTKAMAKLGESVRTLARTSLPILILGETGTGKSALAAHVIHPASGRKGPFVAADLSAIPKDLVTAELFGTARGAFSGAVDRHGLFAEANGGTLLLDEIGNLSLDVQRMLLLAVEQGRVTRLGETTPRPVDVKIVAATNRDLDEAVRAGSFRADLYARLNPSARVVLPPLRDRAVDLEELARGFVRKTFSAGADRALLLAYREAIDLRGPPRAELVIDEPATGDAIVFSMSRASFAALAAHRWPGNVRELDHVIRTATLFALSDALGAAREGRASRDPDSQRTIPIPAKLVRELLGASPAAASSGGSDAVSFRTGPRATLRDVARDLERQLYAQLFVSTGGDFDAMARALLARATEADARRVRLRFNQLGLRARDLRKVDS
jgi:DNA-binding NtrC family response regulator